MWGWSKHGYLAEHCPLRKGFRIRIAPVGGPGKCPSLEKVLKVSSQQSAWNSNDTFETKKISPGTDFWNQTPMLVPRKKENRKQKQKQNTSNTEFKSMYTSKILKTAQIKKRQNLRSQWNTLNLADKNLVRKKKKKTNITLSNIHTVTKHYGIACITIVRLFYITYTRRSWLTDSEGYRCRKFLRPKSNIIQISQALHFNISGIMLVFL